MYESHTNCLNEHDEIEAIICGGRLFHCAIVHKGKKSSYTNHMYIVGVQINDWETRAWCPFYSYVLSESCRIRKWLIHYSVCTTNRDQIRSSDRLGSRDLNLTAIEIIEFPWAHLYPEGEWSERLAWSCPRIASPRDWIRIFFHEAFGVETDPRIFSSVRYVYKRSNVPRTVTSKDSVTPQIWYVCLGEKENPVHHYSLIRSPENLSGGHVKTKIRGISRIFRDI